MTQTANVNASPGALLRGKREAHGWSVAQVAQSMNLSRAQIEAIEADDYEALPGRTYVLGYWKNYARLLEFPFDDVIALNRENVRDPHAEMSLSNEYRDAHAEGDRSSRRAALLIGLLLVGFLAAIWYGKNVSREAERFDLSPAAGRMMREAKDVEQVARQASSALSPNRATTAGETGAAGLADARGERGPASTGDTPAGNIGIDNANRLPETVPHPIMDLERMAANTGSLPLQSGDADDSGDAVREAQPTAPAAVAAEADAAGIATAGPTSDATGAPQAATGENAAQPAAEAPAQTTPETPMDLDSWTVGDGETEAAANAPPAAPATQPDSAPEPAAEPIAKRKPEAKREPRPAARVANRSPDRITVTALKKTWLDVRDANNTRLANKTINRGTTLQLQGKPPFSFFVGTPDGVHVVYGGRVLKYRPDASGKFARFEAGGR